MSAEKHPLAGLDACRFSAVVGMVFVNYRVALAMGVQEPAGWATFSDALMGRASALFVVLAGIGQTLLDDRKIILRRGLFLLLADYLWQWIWPGDILHSYAFYLFICAAVLQFRA